MEEQLLVFANAEIFLIDSPERIGLIKTDNVVLTARVFYALVEGAITYPALFFNGINKIAVKPMLDEIIATFLARYGNKG